MTVRVWRSVGAALAVACVVIGVGPTALANPITTTSTISLSPGAIVTEGTIVTITGNVACTGIEHACPSPPLGGRIQIQAVKNLTLDVFLPCEALGQGAEDIAYDGLNGPGTQPDSSGNVTHAFDTAGLAGMTIGFRSHYVTEGGSHVPGTSSSTPCLDLVVVGSCSGLQIAADLASGDGEPSPGTVGTWSFRIRVHACVPVEDVSAQGGTSGWTDYVSSQSSAGAVSVKANKRNEVIKWTLGDMAAGADETLVVTLSGVAGPCGSVQNLNGEWSASYKDAGVKSKTAYTGKVLIEPAC